MTAESGVQIGVYTWKCAQRRGHRRQKPPTRSPHHSPTTATGRRGQPLEGLSRRPRSLSVVAPSTVSYRRTDTYTTADTTASLPTNSQLAVPADATSPSTNDVEPSPPLEHTARARFPDGQWTIIHGVELTVVIRRRPIAETVAPGTVRTRSLPVGGGRPPRATEATPSR